VLIAVRYTFVGMFAHKLAVDVIIGGEKRPCPLDWLDSFCMRNFTGDIEFDDTLPISDGRIEAGLSVSPSRLATAMGDWFTKRGKGKGKSVVVVVSPVS